MNFKKQVYPRIKTFDKFARRAWGKKAKYIQLKLDTDLSIFNDPTIDIYPYIELTLADNYNDGLKAKEFPKPGEAQPYDAGKKPAWQITVEDQKVNDWYVVQ